MRSHIGISYWTGGQPDGDPWFVNEVDAHPGIEDAWDKIAAALAAVYAVIQTGAAAAPALAKPLWDIINGADVPVERNAEHFFGDDGWAGNRPNPVDAVDFWFRAWSEDDWEGRPGANCQTNLPNPNFQDLGERFFKRGDDNWYEHGFRFELRGPNRAPDGKYVLGGAAQDDGWWFDVAVTSELTINIIPDPRKMPEAQAILAATAVRAGPPVAKAQATQPPPQNRQRTGLRLASLEEAHTVPFANTVARPLAPQPPPAGPVAPPPQPPSA